MRVTLVGQHHNHAVALHPIEIRAAVPRSEIITTVLLIEALVLRRPPAAADEITLDTRIMALVDVHIERLAEDGRSVRTLDTYAYAASKLTRFLGAVRVGEATAPKLDAALRSMRSAHGPVMARQARTILRGALQLAVMASVLGSNPIRDVEAIKSKAKPEGAVALTGDQLRDLLGDLRESAYCRDHDLVDPITVLIATGLRRSELLGLRWTNCDATNATLTRHREGGTPARQRLGARR